MLDFYGISFAEFSGQMWVKIVDFLLMAKFWAKQDYFNQGLCMATHCALQPLLG